MAPALPFPIHKHPPTVVGPLGALNGIPGLPADQGDSAPIEETPEEALEAANGEATSTVNGPDEPPPNTQASEDKAPEAEPAPTLNPTDEGAA